MSKGFVNDSNKYVACAGPAVPGKQYVGTKITPLVSTGEEKWVTVNGNFDKYETSEVIFTAPEDGLYLMMVSLYNAWAPITDGGYAKAWFGVEGCGPLWAHTTAFMIAGKFSFDVSVIPLAKGTPVWSAFAHDPGKANIETTYRPYYYIAKLEEELV